MLKNISDYLSFFTLIFFAIYSFRLFLVSSFRRERDDNTQDRLQLLREYVDNTEE